MTEFRHHSSKRAGFTLVETVLAVGIIAMMITVFFAMFEFGTNGVRQAIDLQEADRLAYAFEMELTTLRGNEGSGVSTGFDKAFNWIRDSSPGGGKVVVVYQYRGDPSKSPRSDGTLTPYKAAGGVAGRDFMVQTVVRRQDDALLKDDLDIPSLQGRVYAVLTTQLVFKNGGLARGTPGMIQDPKTGAATATPDAYPEAAIAFAAEFFAMPNSTYNDVSNLVSTKLTRKVFTRNMAVRR